MIFEEFKKLVQERKELKKLICRYDYMYMKSNDVRALSRAEDGREKLKTIESKLNQNATEKIEGSFDKKYELDVRLAKCFTVQKEKVLKAIQEYFQNDKLIFFYRPEEGKNILVMFGEEFRVSGKNELCLDVLADSTECYGGFKKVLEKYPQLEEVLWNVVEEQMRKPKVELEASLIKKMTERQREIDFLQDEKSVQERIVNLKNEKTSYNKELQEVWQTYDELKF